MQPQHDNDTHKNTPSMSGRDYQSVMCGLGSVRKFSPEWFQLKGREISLRDGLDDDDGVTNEDPEAANDRIVGMKQEGDCNERNSWMDQAAIQFPTAYNGHVDDLTPTHSNNNDNTNTSVNADTDTQTLLARIANLEKQNHLLRQTIEQQQRDSNQQIYFDGFRTRLNNTTSRPSIHRNRATTHDGVYFPLNETNRFTDSLQRDSDLFRSGICRLSSAGSYDTEARGSFDHELQQGMLDPPKNTAAETEKKLMTQSMTLLKLPPPDKKDALDRSSSDRPLPTRSLTSPLDNDRYTDLNDVRNETAQRAMELQKTLNVLNVMLTRKQRCSFDSEGGSRGFGEFYLLGVDLDKVEGVEWGGSSGNGSGNGGGIIGGYLSPLIIKNAHCIDSFPKENTKKTLATEELSMFCLLGGLKVRLVPGGVDKRVKWMDERDYKVLVFTDGEGITSHGIAITIWEEITPSSHPQYTNFLKQLQWQRSKRKAARKIAKWKLHIAAPAESSGKTINKSASNDSQKSKSKKSFFRTSTVAKMSRTTLLNKDNNLRSKFKRASHHILPVEMKNIKPHSDRVVRLAEESYKCMMEMDKLGERVFVQKCYVMMGGKQEEQYLQFRSLRRLVEMEGEKPQDAGSSTMDRETVRHKFLATVQSQIHLNPMQARVTHPRNDLEIILNPTPTFDINLPEFNFVDRNNIHLPLPQVSRHWGLSILFQRLKPNSFLALLRLLLIERSIIILGESAIVVSSCACALLDLLWPYRWASAFMPLLPEDMIDFVQSPCPFITGFIVSGKTHASMIENDYRVVEAMGCGLNVVNLIAGTVSITSEPGIKSMIQKSLDETSSKLTMYRNRLKTLGCASCDSFASFMDNGISAKEIVTLSAVQRVVHKYMKSFAGDIASTSEGWRRYGIYMGGGDEDDDDDVGDFAFYPKLFIQPLRQEIEARLQFQEMMSHSQLFIEYVTAKRQTWKLRRGMARGEIGQFIANWIFEHWRNRKRRSLDFFHSAH